MIVSVTLFVISLLINSPVYGQTWPTFRYYQNQNTYVRVDANNLLSSGFSNTRITYLLIHGFGDNADQTSMLEVKKELVKRVYYLVNFEKLQLIN